MEIVTRPKEGWRGLDLRSTVYSLGPDNASVAKNVDISRASGSLIKRQGSKAVIDSTVGGLGLIQHFEHNTTTGLEDEEILSVGSKLYRLVEGTFTITYTGAGSSVILSHAVIDSLADIPAYALQITVDGTAVDWDSTTLGGFPVTAEYLVTGNGTESSPVIAGSFTGSSYIIPKLTATVAELAAAIDAHADFAVSYSGVSGSAQAACAIPFILGDSFSAGTLVIPVKYYETVNQPSSASDPFANLFAARYEEHFENASYYSINSVTYINTGYDEQQRYDGQKVFRSGLPQPATTFAVAAGAAGSVDNGAHLYSMFYRQRDGLGNVHEGEPSEDESITVAGTRVTVTLPNIQNTTGFNTDMATVNGGQSGVTTIAVTGSTLAIGDTITLIDRATGLLVERTLQAGSTSASVKISGSAVDVNNGDIISAGLTIVVCRTKVGGTIPYVVTELPNKSSAATQSYTDNATDASLTETFDRPALLREHGLPPKGRYGTVFNGTPVITGSLEFGNRVSFADPAGPECWPSTNNFEVATDVQDRMSGCHAADEYLILTKEKSIHIVNGDLATQDFALSEVTRKTGCTTHHSIKQVADGSICFMSSHGPQRMVGGNPPEHIGAPLLPLFIDPANTGTTEPQLRRVIALSDQDREQVYFFVPCETDDGSLNHANSNSYVLMGDVARGFAWHKWENLNWAGGVVLSADEGLIWSERRYSDFFAATRYDLHKRSNRGDVYDYVDHTTPITFEYAQGWESLGQNSVFKLPVRHKVFGQDPIVDPYAELMIYLQIDWLEVNTGEFTLTQGGASDTEGWGNEPWDSFPWGDDTPITIFYGLKRVRCNAFRFVFVNSGIYQTPLISGWEVEVNTKYSREIRV